MPMYETIQHKETLAGIDGFLYSGGLYGDIPGDDGAFVLARKYSVMI